MMGNLSMDGDEASGDRGYDTRNALRALALGPTAKIVANGSIPDAPFRQPAKYVSLSGKA